MKKPNKVKELEATFKEIRKGKAKEYAQKYDISYAEAKSIIEEGWSLACEFYEDDKGQIKDIFAEMSVYNAFETIGNCATEQFNNKELDTKEYFGLLQKLEDVSLGLNEYDK